MRNIKILNLYNEALELNGDTMNVTAFTAKSNLRRQMILHSKKTYPMKRIILNYIMQ